MARALITILLALPLLAPPGVCLCGGAPEPGQRQSRGIKPVKKDCSCCGRCRVTPDAKRAPATPEKHERDCPAVCASVLEKWDASPRVAVEFGAIHLLLTVVDAPVNSVPWSQINAPPPTASSPLYLAHQSLLL